MKNSRKTTTLLILATCLNVACATLVSCKVSIGDISADHIPVYGFDLNHGVLYHGKREKPDATMKLNDERLETEWVALQLSDWLSVRDRLATCDGIADTKSNPIGG